MDILRKELAGFYASQKLHLEDRKRQVVEECCRAAEVAACMDDDCRVVTDAAADRCYIFGGALARLLGLSRSEPTYSGSYGSSDEDAIYVRMHPEDLVEKRMLEYDFFKYVDSLPPADCVIRHCATYVSGIAMEIMCRLRTARKCSV